MVSQSPAHSAHLEKLAPSSAAAVVGHVSSSQPRFGPTAASYFWRLVAHLVARFYEWFYPEDVYRKVALSPTSAARLKAVGRKTLVLDLDETLVHSCYNDPARPGCSYVPKQAIPDYLINVAINGGGDSPISVRVFKRPHVDLFLRHVAEWYDLVIYTASMEAYAAQVLDHLDGGRGLLTRRFYRQHCRPSKAQSKDLSLISGDMAGTFIIDNSPSAYQDFPDNALPIKTFLYDPADTELLKLLPFLDALRFTRDVRSVLGRRVGT